MRSTPHQSGSLRVHSRGYSLDTLISVIAVIAVFGVGGLWLWDHYNEPRQEGDPIYLPQTPETPSTALSNEDILGRLLEAIDRRDYSVVETYASSLFRHRDDLDMTPAVQGLRDPVIRAAHDGDVQLFNALLVAKPAFGATDEQGRRAIHIAAVYNHDELIRWLHEHVGIDVHDPLLGTGETPLHLAAVSGSLDSIRTLLEIGADPTRRSARGRNVMHSIIRAGRQDSLELLQNSLGRDQLYLLVNAKDSEGATPLHLSAESGNILLTKQLLQLGADPSAIDNAGLTALQYAENGAHDGIFKMLSN